MSDNFDLTYKLLFRKYYANLLFYATRIVGDEEAEDVVQDVFVELWRRKDTITEKEFISQVKVITHNPTIILSGTIHHSITLSHTTLFPVYSPSQIQR